MKHSMSAQHQSKPSMLLVMAGLNFIAMYALMYAMVDKIINVIPNFNQFYMAALMTSAMMIIEVWIMRAMYNNQTVRNVSLISVVILIFSFIFIRQQTAIGDKEFLRSMIPHHAAAILMCEKASIADPEIVELCRKIIDSQQSEIDFMKSKLIQLNQK